VKVTLPSTGNSFADEPGAFAQAVVDVLQQPSLREKMSIAGRRLVAEKYSVEMMGQKIDSLLNHVVLPGYHG